MQLTFPSNMPDPTQDWVATFYDREREEAFTRLFQNKTYAAAETAAILFAFEHGGTVEYQFIEGA